MGDRCSYRLENKWRSLWLRVDEVMRDRCCCRLMNEWRSLWLQVEE
ncbi:hypothetical protein [Calothrix sp. 336/3]|nr:hypothetical protein [Calothrix sp. 336/3]